MSFRAVPAVFFVTGLFVASGSTAADHHFISPINCTSERPLQDQQGLPHTGLQVFFNSSGESSTDSAGKLIFEFVEKNLQKGYHFVDFFTREIEGRVCIEFALPDEDSARQFLTNLAPQDLGRKRSVARLFALDGSGESYTCRPVGPTESILR